MTTPLSPSIQQAMSASARGDTRGALNLLEVAIREEPDAALPHFMKGATLAQLNRVTDAEAAYSVAVLLAPAFEMARFQLGLLQFFDGRQVLALLTWAPLLDVDPPSPQTLFVKGLAHLAQGSASEAVAWLEQGIAANRTNEPLNNDMRRLIAELAAAAGQVGPSLYRASAQPLVEKAAEPDRHVLLANYQQRGPVH